MGSCCGLVSVELLLLLWLHLINGIIIRSSIFYLLAFFFVAMDQRLLLCLDWWKMFWGAEIQNSLSMRLDFFFFCYHEKEFQLTIFLIFRSKNFTKKIKPPYPQHKERSSKPLKLQKGTSNGWKIIMKWSKHGWKSKNKKEIWVETKFFLVSKEDSSSIYKYKKAHIT